MHILIQFLVFSSFIVPLYSLRQKYTQMELMISLHSLTVTIRAIAYVCIHDLIYSMKCVSASLSSQPAAGVGPVHAEADGAVPDLGEGSDGAPGEKTLWVFHSCCAPQDQGWSPILARGHTAVPSQGERGYKCYQRTYLKDELLEIKDKETTDKET